MTSMLSVLRCLSFLIFINIFLTEGFLFSQTKIIKDLSGFRGVEWGSKMDKVKATVTESYLQSFHGFGIDALSYRGYIDGLTARIDYSFKDGKLFEGTYIINPGDDFKIDFKKLKSFLSDKYGKADFKAGLSIESDSVWIKVSDYGKFRGPELYWKFNNGFIGLIASKFEDDITISVLYSSEKSIENYGKDRLISTDNYIE